MVYVTTEWRYTIKAGFSPLAIVSLLSETSQDFEVAHSNSHGRVYPNPKNAFPFQFSKILRLWKPHSGNQWHRIVHSHTQSMLYCNCGAKIKTWCLSDSWLMSFVSHHYRISAESNRGPSKALFHKLWVEHASSRHVALFIRVIAVCTVALRNQNGKIGSLKTDFPSGNYKIWGQVKCFWVFGFFWTNDFYYVNSKKNPTLTFLAKSHHFSCLLQPWSFLPEGLQQRWGPCVLRRLLKPTAGPANISTPFCSNEFLF